MSYATRIEAKLREALAPTHLSIKDVSHRHAGHAGARPEGETHFNVEIVSQHFEGLNRVARQRLVYDLLREEMEERVHALALRTLTPAEAASDA